MTSLSSLFPRLEALLRQGIDQKLHRGAQVYISQGDRVLADAAIGENADQQPLQPDTLMLWLSAGKPLTAAGALLLQDGGLLQLDDPVARYLPEFAAAGKESVTLRHLLTHTAGLKPLVTGWPDVAWNEIVARICRAPLVTGWIPGARAAYDPGRSWFILGEVIQRVAALPLADFLREEILLKCEMPDARMAFTPEVQGEYAGRIGIMYSLKDGEFVPSASNLPAALQNPSPGSSFRGPARQLGHFYEMLLRHGATRWGVQILREQTVQAMTSRQRSGLRDETFQHVIDFGLGVILNSQRSAAEPVPYGYGPLASPETFGHGGAQSSVGFADPQHALVVIIITNATPGDAPHQQRMQDLTRGLYEDLGLC